MKDEQAQPTKRQSKLIVRKLESELLVYDLKRDKAICLNESAAAVWALCDGQSSVREMARKSKLDERVVWCALEQLDRHQLLEETLVIPESTAGVTRRQQLKRLGQVAAVAIPLVTAVTAPSAADASTCLPPGAPCSSGAQCCHGICSGTCA